MKVGGAESLADWSHAQVIDESFFLDIISQVRLCELFIRNNNNVSIKTMSNQTLHGTH